MSAEVQEDGHDQFISPSDLGETLSSTPDNKQDYFFAVYSQTLKSWTEYEHFLGVRQHYQHKGRWSKFLLVAIAGMISYQMVLLILVGINWLDFSDYDWLLLGLLVQNMAQIVGLSIYAVKNLFSDIMPNKGSKVGR